MVERRHNIANSNLNGASMVAGKGERLETTKTKKKEGSDKDKTKGKTSSPGNRTEARNVGFPCLHPSLAYHQHSFVASLLALLASYSARKPSLLRDMFARRREKTC